MYSKHSDMLKTMSSYISAAKIFPSSEMGFGAYHRIVLFFK